MGKYDDWPVEPAWLAGPAWPGATGGRPTLLKNWHRVPLLKKLSAPINKNSGAGPGVPVAECPHKEKL